MPDLIQFRILFHRRILFPYKDHSLIINRETLILPLAILITLAGGIFGHHPLKAGMELLFSLYAGSGSGNPSLWTGKD